MALAGLVAFSGVVPGLLGTIKSSFTNLGNDPSVEGRTDDYDIVFTYIGNRPWFGRGPGTFLPSRYIVLDNEALYTLVTIGYVGLVAVIALFVAMALIARKVSRNGEGRRHASPRDLPDGRASWRPSSCRSPSTACRSPSAPGWCSSCSGSIGALWRLDRAGDISGRVRRSTSVLKGWRSVEKPEPHGLWGVHRPAPGRRRPAVPNGHEPVPAGRPATGNGAKS